MLIYALYLTKNIIFTTRVLPSPHYPFCSFFFFFGSLLHPERLISLVAKSFLGKLLFALDTMAPAKTADKAAATAKPLATKVTKETRPRRTTTRSSGGIKYRKRAQTKKANSEPEVLTIDDDNDDDDDDDDVFNVEPSKPPVKGQGAKGKAELEKPVKEKSGPKIIKSIETVSQIL